MDITYHEATLQDMETLVLLRLEFALELAGPQNQETIDLLNQNLLKHFKELTANLSVISFLAKYGDEAVGIGSMHIRQMPGNFKNLSGKWGYIMNMYTAPSFRRKGICSTLLNLLTEKGKQMGVTAFELHATEHGELVYKREGFTMFEEPTYRKYSIENS